MVSMFCLSQYIYVMSRSVSTVGAQEIVPADEEAEDGHGHKSCDAVCVAHRKAKLSQNVFFTNAAPDNAIHEHLCTIAHRRDCRDEGCEVVGATAYISSMPSCQVEQDDEQ